MVLTAVAMAADLDIRFQTALASHLPGARRRTRPRALEQLAARVARRGSPTCAAAPKFAERAGPGARRRRAGCRTSAQAPGLHRHQRWFNTPGGRPLTLAACAGASC